MRWPLTFFIAVSFWNMLGAGVFGFLINPPISLYYLQGLNTTPNHGHAALFGVYGFLALGFTLMVLRYIRPTLQMNGKTDVPPPFWTLNIGLALMLSPACCRLASSRHTPPLTKVCGGRAVRNSPSRTRLFTPCAGCVPSATLSSSLAPLPSGCRLSRDCCTKNRATALRSQQPRQTLPRLQTAKPPPTKNPPCGGFFYACRWGCL